MSELYGPETRKAIENFPVSGRGIPARLVHWLGRIKAAAARVNADLGLLDRDLAERIAAAGDAVARGRARRPVPDRRVPDRLGHLLEHERERGDRHLAGDGVHPNDHVNMGQSLERRVPVGGPPRRARAATHDLLPALDQLHASLAAKAYGVRRRRQGGPHAPDGRRARDAGPGVRRLRRADRARPRRASRRRSARSGRSRSAAPPLAPA